MAVKRRIKSWNSIYSIEMITEDGQKSANLRIVPKGTFIMAITGLEAESELVETAHYLGLIQHLNQSCMALFQRKICLLRIFYFNGIEKSGKSTGLIILRERNSRAIMLS